MTTIYIPRRGGGRGNNHDHNDHFKKKHATMVTKKDTILGLQGTQEKWK
jgi:hypothetical protein